MTSVERGQRIIWNKVLGIQEQTMGVSWRLLVECGAKFSIYSKGEWEDIN